MKILKMFFSWLKRKNYKKESDDFNIKSYARGTIIFGTAGAGKAGKRISDNNSIDENVNMNVSKKNDDLEMMLINNSIIANSIND